MYKIIYLVLIIMTYNKNVLCQNYTTKELLDIVKNKSIFYDNRGDWGFDPLRITKDTGKNILIKKEIIQLLDREQLEKYYLNRRIKETIDSSYQSYLLTILLKKENLWEKKDSIYNNKLLYKKYLDKATKSIIEEYIQEYKTVQIPDLCIILNGYMGYPESYKILKDMFVKKYPYTDRVRVIAALVKIGDVDAMKELNKKVKEVIQQQDVYGVASLTDILGYINSPYACEKMIELLAIKGEMYRSDDYPVPEPSDYWLCKRVIDDWRLPIILTHDRKKDIAATIEYLNKKIKNFDWPDKFYPPRW